MIGPTNPAKTIVTTALTVVLVLGGLLGARLLVRWWPHAADAAPAASTIEPVASTAPGDLEVPCWSCPSAKKWPVRFRTDLDLIAPLGDGSGNAAEFFALFEKQRGPRAAEAEALMTRRFEGDPELGLVVAGDDELLLEAEPWVDQATMRFYPEIFPMEGTETRITNLLFMLTLARSWTVRGVGSEDPEAGLEDCRRAIRLGRLLRQEDVVIINDLVGLASIHLGTRGIYRIARREGDTELALVASVVLGEVAPQRLMTAEKITAFDLAPFIRQRGDGNLVLDLPDSHLDTALETAEDLTERRFFGEVILTGNVILHRGTAAQRQRVRAQLERLAADDDPIIADFARWALDTPPTDEDLAELYPHPMGR
jgi:hypothetical protein